MASHQALNEFGIVT